MALIEVRGYVADKEGREPKTTTNDRGSYTKFQLNEKQKRKGRNGAPDSFEYVYYDVFDSKSGVELHGGEFITVKGYLDIEKWEKGDKRGFNFRISAQSVEVAPARDGAVGGNGGTRSPAPGPAAGGKDPFADEEIPF